MNKINKNGKDLINPKKKLDENHIKKDQLDSTIARLPTTLHFPDLSYDLHLEE